jgi:hypothetical protein
VTVARFISTYGGQALATIVAAGILSSVLTFALANETSHRVDDIVVRELPSIRQDIHELELEAKAINKLLYEIANDVKWIRSRTP